MNVPEILNESQVQELYGFKIPYLRRARRERRGPRFLKIGKLVRYRKSDIESFLTAHVVETNLAGRPNAPRRDETAPNAPPTRRVWRDSELPIRTRRMSEGSK